MNTQRITQKIFGILIGIVQLNPIIIIPLGITQCILVGDHHFINDDRWRLELTGAFQQILLELPRPSASKKFQTNQHSQWPISSHVCFYSHADSKHKRCSTWRTNKSSPLVETWLALQNKSIRVHNRYMWRHSQWKVIFMTGTTCMHWPFDLSCHWNRILAYQVILVCPFGLSWDPLGEWLWWWRLEDAAHQNLVLPEQSQNCKIWCQACKWKKRIQMAIIRHFVFS